MPVQADSNASLVPIDEAARMLGMTASALRYYDDRGLVRPPVRARGRRWYGRTELRGLALLRIAQQIGIPLDAVAVLLDPPGPRWRDGVEERLAELDRLTARAGAARSFLQHTRECPSDDPLRECPNMIGALDALLEGTTVEELARDRAPKAAAGTHAHPGVPVSEDRDGRHEVAVIVRPGVRAMELGLVHQILGGARSAGGAPLYRVRSCALRPGQVPTDTDFAVTVEHGPEILATAGTVVLLGTHDDHENPHVLDAGLGAALAGIRPGTRIASICTAAFPLAAAGLLDGLRATTHWLSVDHFRSRFPQVELDPDVLYVDEGRVLTAAGEASGIDLCLHLVRRDFGAAVANDIARRTVVPPYREGGQAQYIARPVTPEGAGTGTAALREWMLDHLDRAHSLDELAGRLHVGVRTLTRRFRAETGLSPLEWLLRQRIEQARELLETTTLPVEAIAGRCGFGSATALRQHFTAQVGVAPRAYRRTFGGS